MQPNALFDELLFERNNKLFNNRFSIVLERYLNDSEEYLHDMNTALGTNDLVQIANAAHALRSSSITLGIKSIAELASDLEYISRQNVPTTNLKERISELETIYVSVKHELSNRFTDIAS